MPLDRCDLRIDFVFDDDLPAVPANQQVDPLVMESIFVPSTADMLRFDLVAVAGNVRKESFAVGNIRQRSDKTGQSRTAFGRACPCVFQ